MDARMPHDNQSGQSSLRNLKPSSMYGCAAGTKQAAISKTKNTVHNSSFHELSLALMAVSSQLPSCATFCTCASIFATSSFCFACAFSCLPLRYPPARSATAPITLPQIISYPTANEIIAMARTTRKTTTTDI